jgi:hypothetical protein
MLALAKLKLVSVLKDLLRTGVAKYLPSWFAPARYLPILLHAEQLAWRRSVIYSTKKSALFSGQAAPCMTLRGEQINDDSFRNEVGRE